MAADTTGFAAENYLCDPSKAKQLPNHSTLNPFVTPEEQKSFPGEQRLPKSTSDTTVGNHSPGEADCTQSSHFLLRKHCPGWRDAPQAVNQVNKLR